MSRRLAALAARVRRLADALAGLRERVRAAVAAELGAAVGDAVRDLVRALAHGAGPVWSGGPAAAHPDREWDDDPWGDGRGPAPTDRWADADDVAAGDDCAPHPPVSRLAGAVAAAAAFAAHLGLWARRVARRLAG